MLLLRLLARLLGVLWVLALGVLALGVSIYCLDANGIVGLGSLRPDRLADLASVRDHVGRFLRQLAAPGPVAALSLLCGVGAILIGATLLVAILRRPKERLAVLDGDRGEGTLAARPAALRAMVRALAEGPHEVIEIARPRFSLARGGTGGRLTIRAVHAPTSESPQAQAELARALEPLTSPFSLRLRLRLKQSESAKRRG